MEKNLPGCETSHVFAVNNDRGRTVYESVITGFDNQFTRLIELAE